LNIATIVDNFRCANPHWMNLGLPLPAFRDVLRTKLDLVHEVRGQLRSRKIYFVPVEWHARLMSWLSLDSANPPGPIDNSALLSRDGEFDVKNHFHRDFLIVDAEIWPALIEHFPCPTPISRRITIHPLLSTTTILMHPIILEMWTESRGFISKTVGDDWTFQDIRRPLCISLRLIYTEYRFVDWNTADPIDDWAQIGPYVATHGTRVKLQPIGAGYTEAASRASQKLFGMVPLPTFSESRLAPSAEHLRGSSLREIRWPKPFGLINSGNDCYFNAALQCLVRIPLFANFVMSPEFSEQINRQNPAGSGGAVAMEFRAFLHDLCRGSPGSVKEDRKSVV
jgi:hypothetical protein